MSESKVKVGALVRFLNAVGGGRVARISRDTAWVEDEDGFEIPTPISQCVVVDELDTFVPAYQPPVFKKKPIEAEGAMEQWHTAPDRELEPSKDIPAPHSFLPATGSVSAYLAFLPIDEKKLGVTSYETYLINDSKYTLHYVYSNRDGSKWQLRVHGVIEPDRQLFLEEIEPSSLNSMERVNVQILALAENPGIYEGTYCAELRIDPKRFFKLHSFEENDFFDDRAMVLPLVKDSKTTAQCDINSSTLSEAMQHKALRAINTATKKRASAAPNEPLVIDLHIEELLDSTVGMGSAEILKYQIDKFNETMQQNLKHKGKHIIFIHGKGEGVLRSRILSELKYKYKHCRWQDASFLEYSYGATQVIIG